MPGGASAATRLRRVVPLLQPGAAAAAAPEQPPPVGELSEPRPLSDAQVRQFCVDGYLQLHVAELGDAFHARLYETICAGFDRAEPDRDPRQCFPELPELSDVIGSPTLRGALTSLLGAGYGQHPHRTLHTRAEGSGDQAWHKDGHHVPLRHHHPRWLIGFYFPGDTTVEMGATGIMPGAVYTTVDRTSRAFDNLGDRLEDHHLASQPPQAAAEAAERKKAHARGISGKAPADVVAATLREPEELAMRELGASAATQIECKGGTVLLMSYNMFHRAGRRQVGSRYRPMFKLQFFRCAAPPATTSTQQQLLLAPTLQPHATRGAFASTGATVEQQAIWESVYAWLRGECLLPPMVATTTTSGGAAAGHPLVQSAADTEQLCSRVASPEVPEILRVGSAYILGQAAAVESDIGAKALSELVGLLVHPWNVASRCAMYGVAAAGQPAVAPLCDLLERTTAALEAANGAGGRALAAEQEEEEQAEETSPQPSDTIALVCHALGESVQSAVASDRAVAALCAALVVTRRHLDEQIARVMDEGGLQRPTGPVRTGVNVNVASLSVVEGGYAVDEGISLAVRAVAACVHALGMVAERVVALEVTSTSQLLLVEQLVDALLPLSLAPDPCCLSVPGDRFSHDNARFWLAEAAAYGVLRLCSGGVARQQLRAGQVAHATSLQVVCTTCPAHHSDQRYAPALCLGALRRLTEEGDAQQAPYERLLMERLERVREGWEAMAVEAASENPEPWLPAGVSGVEWQ